MHDASQKKSASRGRLLVINGAVSLFGQAATIACSFILTRLILLHYGSEINGLVSSVSQFLNFITFLEMGIGTVVKSALYKPLAEKDTEEISKVVLSSQRFYRTIAKLLILYTFVLTIFFPYITGNQFDAFFTASLVLIISLSMFAQYYFGSTYQLLLNADQKNYIPTLVNTGTLMVNALLSWILIKLGASIQILKLAASLVYIIRPIVYSAYVRCHYNLNTKIKLTEEPIKQKWNGVAQHVAYVVVNYTDIVVLTLFSTLSSVSIYTVYHNVTIGIQQLISCVSIGFAAMLGNILYSENKEKVKAAFENTEWFFHTITTVLFTITGIMMIPFVRLYTTGVQDAEYILPGFAVVITLAQAAYSLRTPYETMIVTANHFKQTQNSAWMEVAINIVISVVLVSKIGLMGVAIGTLLAMIYRTLYFVWYLHKNIIEYRLMDFVKRICVDAIQTGLSLMMCLVFGVFETVASNWFEWFFVALKAGVICLVSALVVRGLFEKKQIKNLIKTCR